MSTILDYILANIWLEIALITAFWLFVIFNIAAIVWYWPGDDSCMAAQWRDRKQGPAT